MKQYTFTCYNEEDNSSTTVSFCTESDTWNGFDGPMYNFFNFLKGCGFCFDLDAQIGVLDEDDVFMSASED